MASIFGGGFPFGAAGGGFGGDPEDQDHAARNGGAGAAGSVPSNRNAGAAGAAVRT